MPGMTMPTVRYDPITGRQYHPYQKRPMTLSSKVWTWILSLPFLCMLVFLMGFYFPSDLCDPNSDDRMVTRDDRTMMSMPRYFFGFLVLLRKYF